MKPPVDLKLLELKKIKTFLDSPERDAYYDG